MERYLSNWVLAALLVIGLCSTGYAATHALGAATSNYDLVVDDMPINFNDGTTLRIDTQTHYRGYVIHNDHVMIRSAYLTYWDFNESYDHEDVCYVTGDYVYAYVPAENLTLDSITEMNTLQLSSWNGTVSVQALEHSSRRIVLEVNSTDDTDLFIHAVGLQFASRYRIMVDDVEVDSQVIQADGFLDYNYTGPWSNHTITLLYSGSLTIVPSAYLNIIYVFLTMGVFVTVTKSMVLPMRQKSLRPAEVQRTLIKSAIYIVVASTLLCMMTNIFIGG